MPLDFDYKGAIKSGYSEAEVQQYLKTKYSFDFDIQGAKKSGYSDDEIAGYIKSWQPKQQEPKPKKFEYGTFPQPIDVLKSMKNQVGNPESFEGGRKPEPEQQPDPEHDTKIKTATDYLLSKEATPEAAEAAKKYAIEKQKRKQEDFQLMVRNRGEKLDSHFDEFSKVGQDEFTNKLLEVNNDPVKKLTVLAKAKEKSNPQEAQEINSNLFLVTHRDYAKTPEDKKKLYEGAEKVKSGEYKLSGSGQLIKPLGFGESAVDAWNRKNEAFDRYEKLKDPALTEEVYAKYDKDLATFSPLDPIGVPDGIVNKFVADAAGMPVLPLVAGAVTGIITRNPEAAQVVGGAVGGADFGILAGVGKHEEAYKKAIMEGKSKEEARDIADSQSSIAQAFGTASGVGMAFVPGAKLSPIVKNSGVINIGKQIVNNIGKEAFQGLQLAGIAAGSKVGENIALNANGENIKVDEGVWDAASGMFMFHMVNQAVMKGSEALGKPLLQKAKVALAKMPKEELEQMQKEDIQQGLYTAEEAAKANEEIDALRPTVESLPTNMKEEATLKAHKIIQKRNELSSKLEVADPALHPSIKERVKALNEEIVALANDKKPREEINDKVGDFFASKEEPISEKTSTISEEGGVGGNVKVESAVIEINGKTYEGKNHAEAILKAKADGQDISQVDRKGQGKFKLSDGTIIDREQAKKQFGQDRAELLIEQDAAADQANKDYKKETPEQEIEQKRQEAVDVSPIHKKYDTQLEKIKSTKPIERVEDFEAELTKLVVPQETKSSPTTQANSPEQNKGQSKEGKLDKITGGEIEVQGKPHTVEQYVSKAKAVLEQLFPKSKIKAYETSAEYEVKEGRPKGSAGNYDPKTGNIAINLEAIRKHGAENTIFHETIHPIIDEVIGKNESALGELYSQLEGMKGLEGMDAVWQHMNQYFDRGGKVQMIEAITEFASLVADGKIDTSSIPPKTITKIIDWVNNLFEKIGVNIKISTATDLKKLSESIKQAFEQSDAKAIEDTLGRRKEVTGGEAMDSMKGKEFDDKVKELIKRSPNLESEQLSKTISDKARIPIEEARQLVSEVRGEQPKPEAAPEPKTESSGGGAKVPPTEQKKTSPYFEQPPFTARIAEIEKVRAQFGLDETQGTTVTNNEAIQSADRKITDWKNKGVYEQKINEVIESAKNGTGNDSDQSVLAQHISDIRTVAKSIKDRNSKEYDNALKAIDKATDALRALRSEYGRALGRSAQYRPKTVESVLDVELDMLADHAVETLTPKQKEQAEQRFNEINKAYEAEKAAREKAEQQIVKLQEEAKLNEQKKKVAANKGVKKTKEQYQEERKNLKQSIKDKWKNAGNDGTLSSDIPFRKQLAAIAPDVAKLIYSYLEEGTAKTLDEVRVLLKKELEDSGISVDDRAVSGLISGEFNEPKKKTANQLKQEVAGLRTEQKLLLAIDAIESGEIPVSERKKIERNQKLKDLQDKLEDVRKRFKVGRYSDESKFETSIKQMIAANKKAEAAALEKIKNKDYSEEPKSETIADNKLLQEKNKALYEEYLKSVVAKDEALLEYERKRVADKKANMDKLGKTLDALSIAVTTAKGTVAMFDQSVLLVQMLPFTMSHPLQALKFAKEGLKDFANKEKFDMEMAKLHNSKFWDVIEKSGLAIYEPRSAKVELRNELHGGEKNLLNKDIIIGKTNWSPGQAFERATNTLLNNARLSLFLSRVKDLEIAGHSFESSPQLYKEAARTANELTGHGEVWKYAKMASPVLNHIIWSTKMFASTLNVLGVGDLVRPAEMVRGIRRALGYEVKETKNVKGYYTSMTPEQAKFAVKELARFIGTGVLVLTAAKAASTLLGKDEDVDIDIDPRSSTFGSIKTENKTFSIFGRYGSAIRTIIQAADGVRMINGKKDVLGDRYGDKTRADVVFGSFGRGKMTPLAGGIYDFAFNNQQNYFTKEKMTLANTLQQQLIPMSLKDIPSDISRDGAIQGIAESLYKLYGGNVTDKRDFLKKKSTKSTKPSLNPPSPRK